MSSLKSKAIKNKLASIVTTLLLVVSFLPNTNNTNPKLSKSKKAKIALQETKKALALASAYLNQGFDSTKNIQEFENSKQMLFKQ